MQTSQRVWHCLNVDAIYCFLVNGVFFFFFASMWEKWLSILILNLPSLSHN